MDKSHSSPDPITIGRCKDAQLILNLGYDSEPYAFARNIIWVMIFQLAAVSQGLPKDNVIIIQIDTTRYV